MKRIVSCVLFLLLVGGVFLRPIRLDAGQTDASLIVYTPRGTVVETTEMNIGMTESEKQSLLNKEQPYVDNGAVRLKGPDVTYNCFAFAFYERDAEKRAVWIDDPTNFWADGSYIEVDHPVPGGIIVYTRITTLTVGSANGPELNRVEKPSHAAVILSVNETETGDVGLSDINCVSKWGKGSLMLHTAENSAYTHETFSGKLTATVYLNWFAGTPRYFVVNPENYASLHMTDEVTEWDSATSKNGLFRDTDGAIRYYVNGTPQYTGLVMDDKGQYYYINSTGEAVVDTAYAYDFFKSNGLLPEGEFDFGADGSMTETPVPVDGTDVRNGIIRMPDGELRYIAECVAQHKGVVRTSSGSYYYFNSALTGVTGTEYAFGDRYANKLLPGGQYSFDSASVMGGLPTVIGAGQADDLANGLLRCADGRVIWCADGVPQYVGLVSDANGNYYYINSARCAVRGVQYAVSPAHSGGLLDEPKLLVFDEDGRLVNVSELNGEAD